VRQSALRISLVTPAAVGTRNGNRNTAVRWARFMRESGHRVKLEQHWNGEACDLMIALHARRSHDSIAHFAHAFPDRPLVVVLTGTDLYRDIRSDPAAQQSLALATRLVVLQEMGVKELARPLQSKTRVIYQSARHVDRVPPLKSCYEVAVSGHLRPEKDPFRAAAALAHLPSASAVRVTHIGGAMSADMAQEARMWMQREPRYRWIGDVAHWRALRILARSRLMIMSSLMEGGANVVSEALAAGVPVIASRVSGNVGMLGMPYPGYFPVGNERALARLISRAEREAAFYRELASACARRSSLISVVHEKNALDNLVVELTARRRELAQAAA
jgi:putative glycosyltransferase (TIGR04348 family)